MLRDVIREDFAYWVHLDCDGGIKVDFIWDQPGGSQIEIQDTSFDVILRLLEKIDWDAELVNQVKASARYAQFVAPLSN